jgi:hypothetical protein
MHFLSVDGSMRVSIPGCPQLRFQYAKSRTRDPAGSPSKLCEQLAAICVFFRHLEAHPGEYHPATCQTNQQVRGGGEGRLQC